MSDIPNPGSPAAVIKGCKCPSAENRYGEGIHGARTPDGEAWYRIDTDCPLHGDGDWKAEGGYE